MKTTAKTNPAVHEAMATVTACKYEFGAGQALAFGIPTGKHFLISFNYWANGTLHTGEFASPTALPQGHLFPITYDPADPRRHSHTQSSSRLPRPWAIIILVMGVLALAVAWNFVLHTHP